MNRQSLAACPLCAAARFKALKGFEKDHLVRCRSCGFTYSRLIPDADDYARVYGAYDYAAEDAARTSLNVEKERAIVARLEPYRRTGKVLDIAAGAGRFLERFDERGFDCHATEFNEEMVAYLAAKGFTAYAGGLIPAAAPRGAFDIVVFTEIIEHINDPLPVLREIAALLRPGGAVYITTPNFASLERRLLGSDWGMICWPEHITYWTPRHLHRALREAGFDKASLKAQNVSPYRIVQALKKRGLASGVSEQGFSDAAQAAVAGNRLLRAAKRAVNALLIGMGLGSSVEAVYVRP